MLCGTGGSTRNLGQDKTAPQNTLMLQPELRANLSRTVNRIRRDVELHIEAIASKRLASIYYSNSQSINMDLTSMEQRVDEVIRVYGHKIRATRDSQELAQEHANDRSRQRQIQLDKGCPHSMVRTKPRQIFTKTSGQCWVIASRQ